ncbi:RHS repeat-associated core domain-containing protein [Streptacidiphilus sp. N1-3]|uniref:RHS repeat-associated core domain-containing protein n=1 Tax=Streptacidiphilus alkalitolerans TaxID=3342712 RepID=A0ABV6X1Z7_9ACTN
MALTTAMSAGLMAGPFTPAAGAAGRPQQARLNGRMAAAETSVPGATTAPVRVKLPHGAVGAKASAPVFPSAGSAELTVPADQSAPVALSADRAGAAGAADSSGPAPAARLTAAGRTRVLLAAAPSSVSATARAGSAAASGSASAGPAKVTVTVAAHATAVAAGVDGTLVTLSRADGRTSPAGVEVGIDYSAYAQAFGGDFGGRLRLVALPACVLTTPQVPACRVQRPLVSANDAALKRLTATVTVPGTSGATGAAAPNAAAAAKASAAPSPKLVLAATSSSSSASGSGTYSATTLSSSNNWSESGNTGSFAYSYPIAAPKALGGSAPAVALGYDSGAVDGKTAIENSQPSWAGDGWDYSPGFIERATVPCTKAKPTAYPNSTDNCFARDASGNLLPAYSISFGGHGGVLLHDDTDPTGTVYRLQHDDGTRITLLTGSPSSAADLEWRGEYFRVQSPDGSVAYFGAYQLPAELNGGTWGTDTPTQGEELEPIFNNPNNSACGDPGAVSSVTGVQACRTTYRWLLDYEVDPHGDVTKYLYSREGDTGYQHWYTGATTYVAANYTRAATLAEIDYSWRTGDVAAGHLPGAKIVFTKASRCVDPVLPNGAATPYAANGGAGAAGCSTAGPTSFPAGYSDTPTDLSAIANNVGPSFWSRYRLAAVDTYVTVGTTPTAVDHYDFFYQFHSLPDGLGNNIPSPLWLAAIRKCAATAVGTTTGGICPQAATAAGQVSEPDVQFTGTGTSMPNRVPGVKDSTGKLVTTLGSYPRERIGDIYTELGSQINVTYDDPANFSPLGCTTPPTAETPVVQPDWHNHQLCYPEYWTPPTLSAPITDWFHKYVVTSVTTTDETSASAAPVISSYAYDTTLGAAWHSNDSELISDNAYRTYDQYLGFGTVTTTVGQPYSVTQDKGHPQTQTVATYLRGMDQDLDLAAFKAGGCNGTGVTPAADCPVVTVADGLGGSTQDDVVFAGTLLETRTLEMPDNTVSTPTGYTDTVTRPWKSDPVASHTRLAPLAVYRSRQTGPAVAITSAPLSGNRTRVTTTEYFHDQANGGRIAYTDALAPTPGDSNDPEECTSTGYANGAVSNLRLYLSYADSATVTTGPCLATPGPVYTGAYNPARATGGTTVSGSQNWYDANSTSSGHRVDAVGTGDIVETDALTGPAGSSGTMARQSSASYDAYGRLLSAVDALGNTTTTTYSPPAGTQPTSVSVTGPGVTDTFGTATPVTKQLPGFTQTTALNLRGEATDVTDPNSRVTHIEYDALGRTSAVWTPDHPKSVYNSVYQGRRTYPTQPSAKYAYTVGGQPPGLSQTAIAPSVVESDALREDGGYARSLTLLDSEGRTRQTQTDPVSGDSGRVVTDTGYDTSGRVNVVSGPLYDATKAPTGSYYTPPNNAQTAWMKQTQTLYDGLGRVTDTLSLSQAAELWRTHTAYAGVDRVDTTPPSGGTATSTVKDARGHTTALYTYHTTSGPAPFGTGDTTQYDLASYGYDAAGRPNLVTDAAGHQWTTGYDLLGRKVSFTDPDAGTTSYGYDAAGHLTDTQDARGSGGALHFIFDTLGRKTAEYNQYQPTALDPAKLQATFTYDSLDGGATFAAKGQATASTRFSSGQSGPAYVESTSALDLAYRPLTSKVVIPGGDGNGALAGTYTTSDAYTPLTGLLDHTVLPTAGNPATGGLAADTLYNGYSQNGFLVTSGDNYADLLTDSGYSPFGEIERRVLGDYPNQVVSDTGYDAATRRVSNTTLSQLAWNAPIDTTAYLYNPAGKITSAIDEQASAATTGSNGIVGTSVATDTQCYSYDYAQRLLAAWTDNTVPAGSVFGTITAGGSAGGDTANPPAQSLGGDLGSCADGTPSTSNRSAATTQVNSGPAPYWQTFSYDNATGNRLSEKDYNPAGDATKDITTDDTGYGAGQPYTLTGTRVTVNGQSTNASYGYDAAGNTTSRPDGSGQDGLNWTAEGLLDNERSPAGNSTAKASYVYAADGTQLLRRDAGTVALYLGATEVHLNTTTGTVTGTRQFASDGAPTVVETGGTAPTLSYAAGNIQGTSSAVIAATPTAAANAVTARRAYTPFSSPRGTGTTGGGWNQAFPDDHTFLGKTNDASTGLVDVGARKYDPVTGRFVSPDPVFQPTDPQALGGYAYADNNPVDNVDPTGLDCHGATPASCTNDGPNGDGGPTYPGSTCNAVCLPGQTVGPYTPGCNDGSYNPSCADSTSGPMITVTGPSGKTRTGHANQSVTDFTGHKLNGGDAAYWSRYYGYNGSGSMTWQDIMDWAVSSENGWNFLCGHVMGSFDCDYDPLSGQRETMNYNDLARDAGHAVEGVWNNRELILNAGATVTCILGSIPSCAKASAAAFTMRTGDHVAKDGASMKTLGEVTVDATLSTITFSFGYVGAKGAQDGFESETAKWAFTLYTNSPSIINNLILAPMIGTANTPPQP